MHTFIYALFKLTTYQYIMFKYPAARRLKFNGPFVNIHGDGEFDCGANSYLSYGTRAFIDKDTYFKIGNNVSVGHNVRVYTSKASTKHLIETGKKKIFKANVAIGNNVLVGANVYIGPGVTICDDVVVGANSVVVKPICESGVYAGIPASKISG